MKKITLVLVFLLSLVGYSQGLPLEGFENTTGPDPLPSINWTLGTGTWKVFDNGVGVGQRWGINNGVATPPLVYAGTNAAYMNRENIGINNTSEDYLVTPLITNYATNGQLRFYTRSFTNGNQGTIYRVMILDKTANSGLSETNPSSFSPLQDYTEDQLTAVFNIYEEKVINLPAQYNGHNIHIAFVMKFTQPTTTIGGDRWLIDNVRVVQRCLDPSNLTATGITYNSANLSWNNPSGATTWEIEIIPATGTPTGVGVLYTGTLPYVIPASLGLLPNTAYKYYVRSVCTGNVPSEWVGPFNFTTGAAPPVCGGNFTDPGGVTGNYPNGVTAATGTTTICPVNSGDKVTVTFTSFALENNYDRLRVYNGPNATFPLIGNFTGTTLPPEVTSTAVDGCLTFVFTSDASVNLAGWTSNVTCAPPPTCPKPTALTTSALTATSVSFGWTNQGTATSWEVLALPCGSPAPNATTPGWIAAPTNPTTLTLSSDTCYDLYVRGVCSATDSSAWAGPKTITTLVAPPVCGGTFTDSGGASGNYPNGVTAATGTTVICPTIPGQQVTVTFTAFSLENNFDFLRIYDGNSSAAPLLGTYTGNTLPPAVTASLATGCLTFVFTSDGSVNAPGWVANVTCNPPPTCPRPTGVTISSVTQTGANISWTEMGTATQWHVLVLPITAPTPTAATTGWVTANTNVNFPYPTPLVSGTQYKVYVRSYCSASDISIWSNPGFFNTLISNDECINAVNVPVNSDTSCAQVANGTVVGATASAQANTCTGTDDDDVWFSFVATNASHFISLGNIAGSTTDLVHVLYSGTCGSLTQMYCSDANSSTANGLVVGQTYYIRVYTFTATANQTSTFTVCVGTPVQCMDSQPFCGQTGLNYSNSVGVPQLGQIGCLFTTPNPAYFYLQVQNSGPISFQISQVDTSGTPIDVDFAAWGPFTSLSAACTATGTTPMPTPPYCSYSAAAVENFTIANAIVGEIYLVLITNFSDDPGTITFNQTNNGSPGAGSTNCDIVCNVNLGLDQSICNATSYTIVATTQGADSYAWYFNGTLISGQTSQSLTVTQGGTYKCVVVCGLNSVEDEVIISFVSPAAPVGGGNQTVCATTPVQTLTASATVPSGSTLVWYDAATGGNVVTSPTLNTVGTITYYAQTVASSGCASATRTPVVLTINALPTAPVSGGNQTVCATTPVQTLTASATAPSGSSVVWYDAATGGNLVTSPTLNTVGTITYYAESVTTAGCISTTRTAVVLTINALPTAPVSGGNQTVCATTPIQTLTASATAPSGSSVVWYSAATGGSVVSNPTLNTLGTITYYAESVSTNGCKSATRTPVILTLNEVDTFTIKEGCENSSYTLKAEGASAGTTYSWIKMPQSTVILGTTASITVTSTGVYQCTVTTSNNCSSIENINVINVSCGIQKGISPNGDGDNEFFDLTGLGVKQLEIFNRYGVKVYSQTNYTDQWHGQSNKGDELPDGTYYYVIERTNGEETKTGWIYINR